MTQETTRQAAITQNRRQTELSGWGRFPALVCEPRSLRSLKDLRDNLAAPNLIARGNGRSYGDAAVNEERTVMMGAFDHFLDFDPENGELELGAGVTLQSIATEFIPRGWFLPVTPGTGMATVGGAIAADVHGKNHHTAGCFSSHVLSLQMLLASGDVVVASEHHHQDLFRATCGGMGLTGIILSARLKLLKIPGTSILRTTRKAASIEEICDLFMATQTSTYSVAWIDCSQRGRHLGRSLLQLGEHAMSGRAKTPRRSGVVLPRFTPGTLLNRASIAAFNMLYFHTHSDKIVRHVDLRQFFYPLDGIQNWNLLYGKSGFFQYQLVIPVAEGAKVLRSILTLVSDAGMVPFLAVLKLFGPENKNYLSFPKTGFTLAMDFKRTRQSVDLAKRLDEIVLNAGGRLYLAKDALMTPDMFRRSYPQWETFQAVRETYGAIGRFQSALSKRIGLN